MNQTNQFFCPQEIPKEKINYHTKTILNNITQLVKNKRILYISSFVLLEISQSILHNSEVKLLYSKKKKILNEKLSQGDDTYRKRVISLYIKLKVNPNDEKIYIPEFYELNKEAINNFQSQLQLLSELERIREILTINKCRDAHELNMLYSNYLCLKKQKFPDFA